MTARFPDMLKAARQGGYAVGSFNVYNYETIRGVVSCARETRTPAIVAFGANYLPNMGLEDVAALVAAMTAGADIPVALHLDHCKSFEVIVRAIKAGFSSVMFDGSSLPFEENLRQTALITKIAHAAGAGVEAELGALARGEHSNEEDAQEIYTAPGEAAQFVAETGVDALAVSIGTVHGMYRGTPRIDVDVLKRIAAVVDIPLVLHGGSGTPGPVIRQCIANGIAKINVNTEISMHALEKIRGLLASNSKLHLSQLSLEETGYVQEVVTKYMAMFRAG